MIRIAAIARHGAAAAPGLSAEFGITGGTIGRAPSSTLMLDDPDRTVSRVHAQVLCRNGQFFIVDRGSNPLLCNGRALGAGNEAALQSGDRLVIGGFELAVELLAAAPMASASAQPGAAAFSAMPSSHAASDDDPFADLLAGLSPATAPAASSASASASTPRRAADASADAASLLFPDPMQASAGAAPDAADPFADLLGPGSGSGGRPAPGASAAALNDFSDLGLPAAGASARVANIDDLFGGKAASQGIGGDPLAMSPLADPMLQPNTAGAGDPFAALQRQATPVAAPRSDHLPVGQFGYVPPVAQPAPAVQAPAAREPAPDVQFDDMTGLPIRISGPARAKSLASPAPSAAPPAPPPAPAPRPVAAAPLPTMAAEPAEHDPFADLLGDFASPPPSVAAAAALAPAVSAPQAAPSPMPAMPVISAAAAPTRPSTPSHPASDDELLAAFLRGLGSNHQPPEALTPALMERVGAMLRASTEGTLQLLLTRQEFKREVRAEVTMIASQANNPLKFSPTVEVALAHLLGPGVRGFMPAEAAMRDAYDDLRAHQFGVMVGMRAALAHVIARFEPAELETKIAARSTFDSLFAAGRKAKLWDQFVALYAGIATEAEDDFHSLFGKAFVAAYEAQMARLQAGDAPRPGPGH